MGKIIGLGISKSNVEKIKRELRKQGYSGLKALKGEKYYSITYQNYKKPKRSKK